MQKLNLIVLMTSLSLHGAGAADRSHYALAPGKVQISGLFGANRNEVRDETKPSARGEFLLGLPHSFAAYADGGWDHVIGFRLTFHDGSGESQGSDPLTARASADLYHFGGGLQWSIPTRSRVVPYLQGGLGWVHATGSAQVGAQSWSASRNHVAGTFGCGAKVHVSRNFGVLADLRLLKGHDMTGLVRVSGGFFYQFR